MENNLDFSCVSRDNVNEYINKGLLKPMYLISPDFGGSEGIENQVIVTPKAYDEKEKVDDELYNFLVQQKDVSNFKVDLKYKGDLIVPSKIIVTAIIDGQDYLREIEVW